MNIAGISQWAIDPLNDIAKLKLSLTTKKFDKFVFYGQTEWSPFKGVVFRNMLDLAESNNTKLIAISGAQTIFNLPFKDRVIYEYSPTFFLIYTFTNLYNGCEYINDYVKKINVINYTYSFASFNNVAHPHRCELIDLIYKNGLLQDNHVSWHHKNFIRMYHKAKHSPFNQPYDFKYWNPTKILLDDDYETTKNNFKLTQNYFSAFAQLVSEATENAIFLTEKTALPLFLKKPFLVATAPGFHNFLKSLGFELYDEIFNYDFDNITNRTERYNGLLENFIKIKNSNLIELYEKIKDKLEFNRLRAVEIASNFLYLSPTLLETVTMQDSETVDSLSHSIINFSLPSAINTYRQLHGDL